MIFVIIGAMLGSLGVLASATEPPPRWATMPEINTWRAFEENVSQAGVMDLVEQWEAHGFRFACVTIDAGWTQG